MKKKKELEVSMLELKGQTSIFLNIKPMNYLFPERQVILDESFSSLISID